MQPQPFLEDHVGSETPWEETPDGHEHAPFGQGGRNNDRFTVSNLNLAAG